MKAPPGPRGHWLLGSLPERRHDALGFYERIHREYGDVVGFRLGTVPVVMLCHPDHVKHVLIDHADRYGKGGMPARLRPVLGNGLLTSEGEFWLRQRRLMQPAFHRESLARLAGLIGRCVEVHLARTNEGEVDIAEEMLDLTLAVASKALFGADLGEMAADVGPALEVALAESNRRLLALFDVPLAIPTPANLRLRRAIGALDRVVFEIIEQRRTGRSSGTDLLTLLIEARDEKTGAAMDDRQLRDEVMTLFLAGHETTASALAWLCHLLAWHPDEQEWMRAGGEARCQMALQEAMRLYPPAWGIPRSARVDDEIGGYAVRKGTLVFVSTWVVHRHPAFWPEPEKFDPDRFAEKPPRHAYIPFGAGQRTCIGGSFAMMESLIAISALLKRFRIHAVPGRAPQPLPLVVLRAKDGIRVRLTRS
ncbi:MAG: cytochrome P450 [Myxococcales bacterium]|nr:cytochrome P450 [Myxococcales bacterium]